MYTSAILSDNDLVNRKENIMNIKRFTDDEITTLNTVRKRPCISEGGECHIVSSYTIFDDGEHIAVTDKADVNVFATAAEAYEWVGSMSGRRDDSCSVDKHVYSVRYHAIDRHRPIPPVCRLSRAGGHGDIAELKGKGNGMAEVTFTEKELGFIDECAIDKKGVLVEMPANPFPSLYRKGVIAKKGDDLMVTKDFREMFRLDGQVVHIDLTEAEGEPEDNDGKFKYGETGGVIIEDAPVDYAGFRQAVAANLRDRRTKGIDEFQLIDKAVQVYDAAREARAANGDEGTRSEHTTVGSRRHWRYALADTVAAFFGVSMDVDRREIVFTGDLYMAGAAELAFEYLFKIGNRRAQRYCDELLSSGKSTVGVYAEKAAEFMAEVEKRLRHEGADVKVDGEVVGEAVVDLDRAEE